MVRIRGGARRAATQWPMAARDRLHPSDLELIDLEVDDDGRHGRFELGAGLIRHDGALYGGTGLAVSVMAMTAATGRDVLWCTTQFVSQAQRGAVIEWTADVLAEGKRASQVMVQAHHDDELVFTALGSVGSSRDDGLTGQYRAMPAAAPPEGAASWDSPGGVRFPDSWGVKIDLRQAQLLDAGAPATALWCRRRDGRAFTPAAIAFAADFVPLGIARAAGKIGAGSSLDNSLRFRPGESTEWILLELCGDFAFGGYGHGIVRVWSQDGTLVATGSQSAAMRYLWSEGEVPLIDHADGAG
jgi:acyl-CoA thioesterase-2